MLRLTKEEVKKYKKQGSYTFIKHREGKIFNMRLYKNNNNHRRNQFKYMKILKTKTEEKYWILNLKENRF